MNIIMINFGGRSDHPLTTPFIVPSDNIPIIIGTVGGIPQAPVSIDAGSTGVVLKDEYGVAKNNTDVIVDDGGTINYSGDVGEETELSTTPSYTGLRPVKDFSSVSQAGINLIKQFEGKKLKAYQDIVGVWTVGYGTTYILGQPVQANREITEEEAEKFLTDDLKNRFLPAVKRSVRTLVTQSMVDALCCFVYNVGSGNLQQSTLLKEFNVEVDERYFLKKDDGDCTCRHQKTIPLRCNAVVITQINGKRVIHLLIS